MAVSSTSVKVGSVMAAVLAWIDMSTTFDECGGRCGGVVAVDGPIKTIV
jgi:hypothetical protein